MFKRNAGPPDGRKYRMGIIFALLMIAGLFVAGSNSLLVDLYSELLTGLGLLYFAYCGGNVSNKWVLGKQGRFMARSGDEVTEPIQDTPVQKGL